MDDSGPNVEETSVTLAMAVCLDLRFRIVNILDQSIFEKHSLAVHFHNYRQVYLVIPEKKPSTYTSSTDE